MADHAIVPARVPEDTDDFVRLFVLSGPEFVPALYAGTQDRVISNCYRYRRNIASFEHTHFVKVNGVNAGMVVAYDWIVNKSQGVKTGLLMARYMRTKLIKQMRHLQWAGEVLGKMDDGTFYIASLAFYPEFRSQGLGTSLLSYVEDAARKAGAEKLELDAETYNEGAIRFYKRFGMNAVGEPRGTVIDGQEFEFIRLSKDIRGGV
jgi:ribosomal protein S18 acetylase RimI-like enzyme